MRAFGWGANELKARAYQLFGGRNNEKNRLAYQGGDAPGMNACIRAVVRTAIYFGMEVYGIERGYQGLIDDDMVAMEMRSVSDIVQRASTKLRTARCLEMLTKEGQKKAVKTLEARGLD